MATGKLQIQVTSQLRAAPVEDAVIDISSTGEPDQILEEVTTNSVGQTDTLELEAPPEEYSLSPGEMQPYSEYNFRITAPGYEPLTISGAEILANQLALQDIRLKPLAGPEAYDNVVIPAHTLYGDYPPKIAEAEIKPLAERRDRPKPRSDPGIYRGARRCPDGQHCGRLLCALPRLYQKCGFQRNLCHLAEGRHPCQCAGDHVVYLKPCIHGMVPQ